MRNTLVLAFLAAAGGACSVSGCGGSVAWSDGTRAEDDPTTPGGDGGAGVAGFEPPSGAGGSGEAAPSSGAAGGASSEVIRCPGDRPVAVTGPACGDGELDVGEMCDDGNPVSGDGCSSRCLVERGWACLFPGIPCNQCGDCVLEEGEGCDDGNSEDGDGCSESCQVESGFWCGPNPESACISLGACGDGIVNAYGELCDDGNAVSSDGCSADCQTVELGYLCREPGVPCERVVDLYPHCRNGVVEPQYGEECDEGADNGGVGGCAADCTVPYCGDGQVQPELGEACDDGVNNGGYGECAPSCVVGVMVAPDCASYGPYCGDGVVQPEYEECDYGPRNAERADCEADCTWGRPGYCGDGVLDVGYEECDDGNLTTCDGCSAMCQQERPVF
ncbi:MAG: DUF4215 domain-containing protein [Polyangiaceae bacterium]|nr:DUF4215 domain-containing protein [Polyangiaceae bacterium]